MQKSLQVTVESCSMLTNTDGFLAGLTDPYVIVSIPGKKGKIQTPVISNDLNPVWNHTDVLHDYAFGDELEFQVWDSDTYPKRDQLVGKVSLTAADFGANPHGMAGELPIQGTKAGQLSMQVYVIDAVAEHLPAVAEHGDGGHLAPAAVPHEQAVYATAAHSTPAAAAGAAEPAAAAATSKLMVTILSAAGLPNKDAMLTGKSDPYCICQVPGTGGLLHKANKFQTPVIANNCDPVWNHVGEIPHFKASDALEFQVWDQDTFPKPDQHLGSATLHPEDFAQNPSGLEGDVPLVDWKGGYAGMLRIYVEVHRESSVPHAGKGVAEHVAAITAVGPEMAMPTVSGTVGLPPKVAPGSAYAGGILVSETWHPPVPRGRAPSNLAQAQTMFAQMAPPARPSQMVANGAFNTADRNHDGSLSRAGFNAMFAGAGNTVRVPAPMQSVSYPPARGMPMQTMQTMQPKQTVQTMQSVSYAPAQPRPSVVMAWPPAAAMRARPATMSYASMPAQAMPQAVMTTMGAVRTVCEPPYEPMAVRR